ncbi:hypothetical protein BST96_01670 [Oceanicoccus sagamiensis]|uniref:Short-chain dehydrogenase n=1 Tax=Oceanicoccus sagamiensis TaxID=716816 RepID=A0A1X9NDZ5_9GAMM|nr:hypothetical protein BST96_01670 [Oceanicoccus sagamiensis]
MPTVLVTGSNRGIGLELVKQFAANGWNVIGTARKPAKAKALNALAADNDNVAVVQLDVTNADSIAAMAKTLEGQPIDVLLNNAGVYGNKEKQNFDTLDADEFNFVINVNALGPMKVSQALLPNIRAGQQKKILAMGSGLGSMAIGGRRGGSYWYKMSKSALHMGMLAMRSELKDEGIIVQLIAPGIVQTDLLRASTDKDMGIPAAASVEGLLRVVDSITMKTRNKMINYNGATLPW